MKVWIVTFKFAISVVKPEEAEDNEEEEKENLGGGATKYDLPQGCASTVY